MLCFSVYSHLKLYWKFNFWNTRCVISLFCQYKELPLLQELNDVFYFKKSTWIDSISKIKPSNLFHKCNSFVGRTKDHKAWHADVCLTVLSVVTCRTEVLCGCGGVHNISREQRGNIQLDEQCPNSCTWSVRPRCHQRALVTKLSHGLLVNTNSFNH